MCVNVCVYVCVCVCARLVSPNLSSHTHTHACTKSLTYMHSSVATHVCPMQSCFGIRSKAPEITHTHTHNINTRLLPIFAQCRAALSLETKPQKSHTHAHTQYKYSTLTHLSPMQSCFVKVPCCKHCFRCGVAHFVALCRRVAHLNCSVPILQTD